jgi:hypothetical protein
MTKCKSGGKTQKRRCSMKGGVGAADTGIAVFGDMKDQQPVGGGDNTIVMKQIAGGNAMMLKKGGNMITDLGVPVVLVAANHLYKKRDTKKGGKKRRGTKKNGKSRRYRK